MNPSLLSIWARRKNWHRPHLLSLGPDRRYEIKVEVSRDGESFVDFNEYEGIVADRGKGAWAEIDLRAVKARYFRLSPKFQGWGHLWGEVEFWEIVK